MKIFFLVLALLIMGLVFIAPPLIMAAPVLLLGLALFAVPALLRGLDQDDRSGDDRAPR
jgi:hypothetical protein